MSEIHLVTGGLGFIGSHVVECLAAAGKKIRILDNMVNGHMANVADTALKYDGAIEVFVGDIRDRQMVARAMSGITHVYHLAALGSVPRSTDNPHETNDVNVLGTISILEAARRVGVKRFVLASSSSVYGDTVVFPRYEDKIGNPKSFYASSKLSAELACSASSQMYGMPVVVLRYFNVFGPRQKFSGPYCAVAPVFIRRLLRGEEITVHGTGTQSRDFTYVRTVAEATVRAGEAPDACFEIINVASGTEYSINEFLRMLADATGAEPNVVHHAKRPGDASRSLADIKRMTKLLGVTPTPILDGIRETVAYYRERS